MLQQVTNPVQCVLASEVPCCVGSGFQKFIHRVSKRLLTSAI